jgi:hypothetical protein
MRPPPQMPPPRRFHNDGKSAKTRPGQRTRGQRIRGEDDDANGARIRQARIKVAPAKEQEEEEDEQEEKEEKQEDHAQLMEKLANIGVCPANYQWNRGLYVDQSCGVCAKTVHNGYRCSGGSHYVCLDCVNTG